MLSDSIFENVTSQINDGHAPDWVQMDADIENDFDGTLVYSVALQMVVRAWVAARDADVLIQIAADLDSFHHHMNPADYGMPGDDDDAADESSDDDDADESSDDAGFLQQ